MYLFILAMWVPECMHVHHMQADASGRNKKLLIPLELELQTVVICHVDAGKWDLDPLEEQPVLLTAEPAPQPLFL